MELLNKSSVLDESVPICSSEPEQGRPSAIGMATVFEPKQFELDVFVLPQSQATVDRTTAFLECSHKVSDLPSKAV